MMQCDVIGLQETSSWPDLLLESWSGVYTLYKLADFTGNPKVNDSDCGIFFNKLRYEIVDKGYRNLNRSGDIKDKKADWGAKNSRQVGWLRLRDRATGLQFYFHNTHLAWAGESYKGDDGATGTTDDLHARQMLPCVEEVEKACPLLPQIFVGDFNNTGGAPWRMLVDEGPFDAAHSHKDKAFGIDWIVGTSNLKLTRAGTVYAKEGDVRASDHLQILAYFELPDLAPLIEAHEAAPDDRAAALAYARALVMTDAAAAGELLDETVDALDKGKRDEPLWLFAQVQEYFLEPADAIKTYRKLEKETEDPERRNAAIYRGFAVLVWRKLAKPRDLKLLQKFADDKDTPPAWADKARKLAEQAS
jgi:endonuclease/exonuclease/phosphatase family metal-dependent hydrolase